MTDTIVVAFSPSEAAAVAAAVSIGAYDDADRLVLLMVDATEIPELSTPIRETPAFRAVSQRFDLVLSLNDLIFPEHPLEWAPRGRARRDFRALLGARAGVAPDARLSVPAEPAPLSAVLASLFPRSHVTRTAMAPATGELAEAAELLSEIADADADVEASLGLPARDADDRRSPWERLGIPAPVARWIPQAWFEPVRDWARLRLSPLVIRWRRARQDFADVALPPLTPEDFTPRGPADPRL